jgi:transaldolase
VTTASPGHIEPDVPEWARTQVAGGVVAYVDPSVASFFVSRIDTKVDEQLPAESPLRGTVALANARVAYQRYLAQVRRREMGAARAGGREAAATVVGKHRQEAPPTRVCCTSRS